MKYEDYRLAQQYVSTMPRSVTLAIINHAFLNITILKSEYQFSLKFQQKAIVHNEDIVPSFCEAGYMLEVVIPETETVAQEKYTAYTSPGNIAYK